ncbi:MAG: caspase family protein [Erythrobacter sp.]|uniref:caspase family protein n=1 Tax=Erythrobacter sp. TaxID=1042 RepID=UPI0032973FC7
MTFAAPAQARKVALIIGNSNYEYTGQLPNAGNDATLIASAARDAGFEDVVVGNNLGVDGFRAALREFRQKADGADVAMVYFAGHGIEGSGKNWLIPTDAKLEAALDLPYESIDLDLVMQSLSGAQVRIAVLDACRNNPFGRTWNSGSRAVTRGLVGVEADDVLVIYAAAPGQTASDGEEGNNSPFAESLARRLPEPDVPVQLLGGLVRDDVLSITDGQQRPFISASITGTPVYLVRENTGVLVAGASTAQLTLSGRSVRVTDVTIETIKLTGFFGQPDNLFIEFSDGSRFPEGKGDSFRVKKGDVWEPKGDFVFESDASFQVMEFDDIGGHDLIGLVQLAQTAGVHTVTLNGDRSEYKVTYRLVAAFE